MKFYQFLKALLCRFPETVNSGKCPLRFCHKPIRIRTVVRVGIKFFSQSKCFGKYGFCCIQAICPQLITCFLLIFLLLSLSGLP